MGRCRESEASAPPKLTRFVAGLCLALTLLLAGASVSPSLHACLDGHASGEVDHGCAVATFASGLVLATTIAVVIAATGWREVRRTYAIEVFVATVRYRWLPPCGPPAG